MANPKHVALVRKGAAAIAKWRQAHPDERLDLSDADLRAAWLPDANLSGANLSRANLSGVNLRQADLRRADLRRAYLGGVELGGGIFLAAANLSRADLNEANLSRANLIDADLRDANLSGGKLGEADLTRTNLSGATLIEADLGWARLWETNLNRANLRGADLSWAGIWRVNLTGAELTRTELREADLREADLSKANLSEAHLSKTYLTRTNLREADFSRARLDGAYIVNVDLSAAKGLAAIDHLAPSSVGMDTLIKTVQAAGNKLTPDLTALFLGAGVPREVLDVLPGAVAEIKYDSCFISYGEPDVKLAKQLGQDLKSRGVLCWLYEMDRTVGKSMWKEIGESRRGAERFVVLCSAAALVRDGLLKEIEQQIDEDADKVVPISLDDLWKERGFRVQRVDRDLKPFLLGRNYADFSNWDSDPAQYDRALEELLNGLQRPQAKKARRKKG